jgi:hypothetical protein
VFSGGPTRLVVGVWVRPLIPAVAELDWSLDHYMRAELLGQRGRGLDPQSAVGVNADGLVPAQLARLAIRGEEHPGSVPAVSPLLLGHFGGIEVIAGAPQPLSAHRNRRMTRRQRGLGTAEPLAQRRQPSSLRESLIRAAISAPPPRTPPGRPLPVRVDRFRFARAQRTPGL